jgi:hypothetical protein
MHAKLDLSRFAYIQVPNPDKQYLLHFDGGILDYRLNGKPNPNKTFETHELSGLTRSDCTRGLNLVHLVY